MLLTLHAFFAKPGSSCTHGDVFEEDFVLATARSFSSQSGRGSNTPRRGSYSAQSEADRAGPAQQYRDGEHRSVKSQKSSRQRGNYDDDEEEGDDALLGDFRCVARGKRNIPFECSRTDRGDGGNKPGSKATDVCKGHEPQPVVNSGYTTAEESWSAGLARGPDDDSSRLNSSRRPSSRSESWRSASPPLRRYLAEQNRSKQGW